MHQIKDNDVAVSLTPHIENPDSTKLEIIENGDSACFELLDIWNFQFNDDLDLMPYCFIMSNIYNHNAAYYKVFQEGYNYGKWRENSSAENKLTYLKYLKKWISLEYKKWSNIQDTMKSVNNKDIYSHSNRPKAMVCDSVLINIIEQGDIKDYAEIQSLTNNIHTQYFPYDAYCFVMADIYGYTDEYLTAIEFLDFYYSGGTNKEDMLKGLYYYDLWADYMIETIYKEQTKQLL